MNNRYFKLVILLLFCLSIHSCNLINPEEEEKSYTFKKPSPDDTEVYGDNGFPDDILENWDNLPTPTIDFSDIVLPDGGSLKDFSNRRVQRTMETSCEATDRKLEIIAYMLQEANILCTRSNFIKGEDGKNKPAQPNGLAYGFGNKDPNVRQNPHSPEAVYGLDCSGFIKRLFANGGVVVPAGPAELQRKVETLNKALTASVGLGKIEAKDLGPLGLSEMATGDIIYWYNSAGVAKHIGMIFTIPGLEPMVVQSNGSDLSSCGEDIACLENQLKKNRGLGRGPRFMYVKTALTGTGFWGDLGFKYGIVRLTEIAPWGIKLVGHPTKNYDPQSYAWMSARDYKTFYFPEKGGKFTVIDTINSYGSISTYNYALNYNKDTKILNGKILMTFFHDAGETYRTDTFNLKIENSFNTTEIEMLQHENDDPYPWLMVEVINKCGQE